MRYCTKCHHLTAGDPLFCGVCGATYNVRLCPRLHMNPRGAQVCSQCGSRDLSEPQPPVSFFTRWMLSGLQLLPFAVLMLLSLLLFFAFVQAVLTNQEVQGQLLVILLFVGIGWWVYMKLPHPIRTGVSRLVRRRKGDGGRHH